ncbi:energy transducer TonB [Pedobacter jejuensis]|uniref:TonB C-terminal domain-containing protein n=1 Tax=Pedobacter jejuensis TaxID=1268550 RepID=A0A3N0BLY3_9SPHI|nr:energy transducer TonB [Pedobacter jejuensis]RNL49715.1 hypothetical protein D7004_20095 [Pedobacter jejuensis]
MKYLISIIFCFIAITSFAQKSDTLYSYTNIGGREVKKDKAVNIYKIYKRDDSTWIRTTSNQNLDLLKKETFIDAKLNVLNGNYREYFNGRVVLEGVYLKGNKNDLWIRYDSLGKTLESETYKMDMLNGPYISYWPNGNIMEAGSYVNGKLDGDWKLYTESGELKSIKNFNNGTLLPADKSQIQLVDLTPPVFPGGMPEFYKYIGRNIRYPKEAINANITGRVYFIITIDKEGKAKDFKIISSPSDSLSDEAKRVMLNSPRWTPGTEAGKPVDMKQTLNINFSMN